MKSSLLLLFCLSGTAAFAQCDPNQALQVGAEAARQEYRRCFGQDRSASCKPHPSVTGVGGLTVLLCDIGTSSIEVGVLSDCRASARPRCRIP